MGGVTCWPSYEGGSRFRARLHGGGRVHIAEKIAHVDVDDDFTISDIVMLELDDSSETFHCMQYDAVLRLQPPFFPSMQSIS